MRHVKDYLLLVLVCFTIVSLVLVWVFVVHESSHALVCRAFGGSTTITLALNGLSHAGCDGGPASIIGLFLLVLMPYLVDTVAFVPIFLGLWIRRLDGKPSARSLFLYSVLIALLLAFLFDMMNYLSFDFKEGDIVRAVWLSNAPELSVIEAWSLKTLVIIPIFVIWSGTAALLIRIAIKTVKSLRSPQNGLIHEWNS